MTTTNAHTPNPREAAGVCLAGWLAFTRSFVASGGEGGMCAMCVLSRRVSHSRIEPMSCPFRLRIFPLLLLAWPGLARPHTIRRTRTLSSLVRNGNETKWDAMPTTARAGGAGTIGCRARSLPSFHATQLTHSSASTRRISQCAGCCLLCLHVGHRMRERECVCV
ncbi:hypothetical protein LY76DRAFT_107901 [Colletotrichum caudatum]|nr:hypothetical protein LY76DRAFT_107901 [Colletotrichum caudatum]